MLLSAKANYMAAQPSCERTLNSPTPSSPAILSGGPSPMSWGLGGENGLLFEPRAPHGLSLSHLAIGAAGPIGGSIHSPKTFWFFPERTPCDLVPPACKGTLQRGWSSKSNNEKGWEGTAHLPL